MNKLVIVLLSVLLVLCKQEKVSAQVSVDQLALVPALKVVLPLAEKKILNVAIPDISDSGSVYSLDITELAIKDVVGLNTDNIKVMFVNNQLQVTVRSLRIDVTGEAKIQALFFSADGTLSIVVNDITANVLIGQTFSNNRVHFDANQVQVNTGKIDLDISGDFGAKILNLFTGFLETTVHDAIVNAANKAIKTTLIPKLDAFLQTVKYDYAIKNTPFSVHVQPSSAPTELNGYLQGNAMGYAYNTAYPGAPAIQDPTDMSVATPQTTYARVLISDYILNSALFTLHQVPQSATINQDLLDKLNLTQLDNVMTSEKFEIAFAGFIDTFGANKKIQLVASLSNQGLFQTSTEGVAGNGGVHIDLQIMNESGQYETKGYLASDLSIAAFASVIQVSGNQQVIVKILSGSATNVSSDHDCLTNHISDKIKVGIEKLNEIFAKGIIIPDITLLISKLTNTQIAFYKGFLSVESSYEVTGVSQYVVDTIAVSPFTTVLKEVLHTNTFKNVFNAFFKKNQYKLAMLLKNRQFKQ